MNRTVVVFTKRAVALMSIPFCAATFFYWTMSAPVHSQDAAKPEAANSSKPATVKAETGKIVLDLTLKGTVEADETNELFLDAKSWAGPFVVKSAVPHGTRVKKGDIVLELDTSKIDQAIKEARLDRELAEIALKQARDELPILEQYLPMNLAAADREKRIAEEDFKRYTDIEREHTKKSSEFQLKSQMQWLEYSREELKQLQKMYRDKDLTEETEEMILKRQRHQIEQLEFAIESLKLHQEREATLDLPRRDQSMKDNLQKQTLAWQKSQSTLPLEMNQKRVTLQKHEIDRTKNEERLQDLETDRAAMVFRAPRDGIVYHGQADRAQWNTASVSGHLKRNGSIQPKEVFMTVVATKPVSLHADVEEKDLQSLKEGLAGQAVPVAFASMKLPCRVKSVSMVPRSAGSFETRIALDIPDNVDTVVPGMVANAKFVTYRKDNAVLVPTSAIFQDEGSDASYVLVFKDGKPVRTDVEIGKASGSKTEVLKGLTSGTEILASKP